MVSKHCQKPLDHVKQSAMNALKTASKRAVQTRAESSGHSIDIKIADIVAKFYE